MKITWLGHSGFRIEIGGQVLLVDPFLTGNPKFPAERRAEAITGATHLIVTHAHGDHSGDIVAISRELAIPVLGMFDLIAYWQKTEGIEGIGFNKGGTIDLGGVKVTMVNAVHSSTLPTADGPRYLGTEAGYMIEGEGHVIYVSGDTDVMADMKVMNDLHQPDIGLLCAGGRYTMDMRRAAYAAKTFFNFKVLIPSHFGTFPGLAADASELIAALPEVNVIEPKVLEAIEI